jgi:ribosomal protein S18 acetylase RimI-like enzyme
MSSGSDILIRPLREAEIPAVCRLLRTCYEHVGRREGLTRRQIDWIIEQRAAEHCVRSESREQHYLVATTDWRGESTIVGMAAIRADEITRLYVAPDHHRRGVGRLLFAAAEELIRQSGHERLVLGTMQGTVGFYESMGAGVEGTKPYRAEVLQDREVVLMRKEL